MVIETNGRLKSISDKLITYSQNVVNDFEKFFNKQININSSKLNKDDIKILNDFYTYSLNIINEMVDYIKYKTIERSFNFAYPDLEFDPNNFKDFELKYPSPPKRIKVMLRALMKRYEVLVNNKRKGDILFHSDDFSFELKRKTKEYIKIMDLVFDKNKTRIKENFENLNVLVKMFKKEFFFIIKLLINSKNRNI